VNIDDVVDKQWHWWCRAE